MAAPEALLSYASALLPPRDTARLLAAARIYVHLGSPRLRGVARDLVSEVADVSTAPDEMVLQVARRHCQLLRRIQTPTGAALPLTCLQVLHEKLQNTPKSIACGRASGDGGAKIRYVLSTSRGDVHIVFTISLCAGFRHLRVEHEIDFASSDPRTPPFPFVRTLIVEVVVFNDAVARAVKFHPAPRSVLFVDGPGAFSWDGPGCSDDTFFAVAVRF